MQQLWTSGIDWDDPIPTDVGVLCSRYQSELHQIENISTPRHITHDNAISTQLHEFYDSSEKGYAAAIYLRVETATSIHCQLIIGKSNVAPLKRTTIPRLKLCSAHLAAKLLHLVRTTYTDRVQIDDLFAWTDFTTALVWIRSSPHRWDTFVANRTSQIQELTTPSIWRHVPTKLNPADCASKGLFPSELENHSLWWTGPLYLLDPPSKWPGATFHSPEDQTTKPLEKTKQDTVLHINLQCSIQNVLTRFSSFNKILRVIAYCLRFWKSRSIIPLMKSLNASEITSVLSSLIYSSFSNLHFRKIYYGLKKVYDARKIFVH
jgi:hypothetical protein